LGLRGFEIAGLAGVKNGQFGGVAFVASDDIVFNNDGQSARAGNCDTVAPFHFCHGGKRRGLWGIGGEGIVKLYGIEVEVKEVGCGCAGAGFAKRANSDKVSFVVASGLDADFDDCASGEFLDGAVAQELEFYEVGVAALESKRGNGAWESGSFKKLAGVYVKVEAHGNVVWIF
jgi:hypothetical protein